MDFILSLLTLMTINTLVGMPFVAYAVKRDRSVNPDMPVNQKVQVIVAMFVFAALWEICFPIRWLNS